MKNRIKPVIKFLLFFIAAAWILHTFSKNFVVDPDFKKFLLEKSEFAATSAWLLALRVHIVLAIVALLAGPFGFVESLRRRNIKIHRYAGRIYVVSILLNFVPSVYLACFATGGAVSAVGFFALNLIWVGVTYKAYRSIRNKQVAQHRRWMIRSYAVTLANLQLYVLKTVLSKAAGLNYELAYTIAVWCCWIFGLLVAEIIIRNFSSAARNKAARRDEIKTKPEITASGEIRSV